MQKINEIIARRSSDLYYKDCTKGARLNRIYKSAYEMTTLELERMNNDQLAQKIRRTLEDKQLDRLRDAFREEIIEIVADVTAERMTHGEALRLGCRQQEHCIFCPDGRELLAREIYEYAMGGKG